MDSIWSSVLGLLAALVTGGGLVKILDWLRDRQQLTVSARAQERADVVKEYGTFLGELRGEIHGLRDRLQAVTLQHEVCLKENAALNARLHALEERVGDLTAAGGVAHISIDADGKVIAWSPAATEMFGYPAAEAVGWNLGELIVLEGQRPLHEAAIRQCVQEDRPPRAQALILRAKNKWNHEFLVDVQLSGTKANGQWFFSGMIRRRMERFD